MFEERGKVRLGKSVDWIRDDTVGSKLTEPPAIGIWGVVKKNRLSLEKIAQLVYGDESLAKFIKGANGVGEYVAAGTELYIPHITWNSVLEIGQATCSRYSLTKFDLSTVKGIVQVKDDVFVDMDEAVVDQYYYTGKDHKSELFVDPISLTLKTYIAKMHGLMEACKRTLDEMNGTDKPIDFCKALAKGYFVGKNVQIKKGKHGRNIFKIGGEAEGIERTYSWVGRAEFAQRFYVANRMSKEDIGTTMIFAGISTVLDLKQNDNINHAVCTFGREVIKGVISSFIALGAAAIVAAFIPGVGWIGFLGIMAVYAVVNYYVAKKLDNFDKYLEGNGIYPAWAKLNESMTNEVNNYKSLESNSHIE